MANDNWRTPRWLFDYVAKLYGPFDVDLAASAGNALAPKYVTLAENSLTVNWLDYGKNGFCNPPYSDLEPWLYKAAMSALTGFSSTWILPAWNGEKFWDNALFQYASDLRIVFGRVGFLDETGQPINSNRAGTMIAHYSELPRDFRPGYRTTIRYVDRDDLITARCWNQVKNSRIAV
jgi:phage N-6-adenine-methyltransferase